MNETTLAIGFGTQELLIILLIVFVLFGASRLPQLAKALGQSKRAFKDGLDEADDEARIAEAKRRERLRAAESTLREDELSADKYTADKPR
ncbi:MAG: sec-independent protein translocase protein TatA [Pyrinomonadaceae bacterium]|jgi:sec-independent protein translocase protein TatA|nr:sec-independent protein translocase protein TatA [Pyrinomonadaceae bacterium]MDQ1590645.1 sec-independent protein translocase protein TatA [Pyrinomonadaceae bacterium]